MILISKKSNKAELSIIGGNCEGVTGSCTEIEYNDEIYLFECGMVQCNTINETYAQNKKILEKIKPNKIAAIIIGHCHTDHIGLIPALYATGKCVARIIIPERSTAIMREMWLDSAYILERDSEVLSKKAGKYIAPLYTQRDVEYAMQYIEEYTSHEIHRITDNLSIRYTPAGHIFLSQQTEVMLKGVVDKSILFTSDLGNIVTQSERVFVERFEPINKANIVIGECTYSKKGYNITKKDYFKDVQKIKSVIEQYCIDSPHRVVCPTFSLDRLPYMMWIIYSIFKDDDDFTIKILVDSPLAIRLLHCYSDLLYGEPKEKFDSMMSWANFTFVQTPEDSKAAIEDEKPKVVLSCSGMLTAGRSVKWVQSVLPNTNDCILFAGYSTEGTLAYRIKNGDKQKTVSINGKPYKNKANIISLHSFSGHMNRESLLDYYSNIIAERIYLVHSDKNKSAFKDDLEDAIQQKLKTTKVIMPNKSTRITL